MSNFLAYELELLFSLQARRLQYLLRRYYKTGLVESYIDPPSFDEFFFSFLKFTFFIIPLNERGHVFIVDWCHRGGSHTSLRRTAKLEAASRTFSPRLFDGRQWRAQPRGTSLTHLMKYTTFILAQLSTFFNHHGFL